MSIRILPKQMADIYFNRLNYRSVFVVSKMVHDSRIGSPTAVYWSEVLHILKDRTEARSAY